MLKQFPKRQRIRKGMVILAFLTFPVTMNFLSPYVIVDGAMNGVVNGSLVMFGLMFASSLFLGRAWCGWVCPGGGIQEIVEPVNRRPVNGKRIDWIKWAIWIPWITLIAWLAVSCRRLFQGQPAAPHRFRHLGGRTLEVHHLLPGGVPVCRAGGDRWQARRLPCHLLDGALHDHRALAAQPLRLGFLTPGRGCLGLQQLHDLYQQLPDEPGRERHGAG